MNILNNNWIVVTFFPSCYHRTIDFYRTDILINYGIYSTYSTNLCQTFAKLLPIFCNLSERYVQLTKLSKVI